MLNNAASFVLASLSTRMKQKIFDDLSI